MSGDQRPQEADLDRLIRGPRAPRELLEHGELHVLGQLAGASNATLLARVSDGERFARAVVKPRRGEAPLWDFPPGVLHRNEVAAAVLARIMGAPRVPETVLRDHAELGPAAVQAFVAHDARRHALTLDARYEADLRAIALFDVVANNADRKAGHVLVGTDEALWVIDHGICFSPEPKLRTVLWHLAGEQLTPQEHTLLARVMEEVAASDELHGLLDTDAFTALQRRLRSFAATGLFPEPPAERPAIPWPPV